MKVPLEPRRIPASAAATALLLPGHDPKTLLDLCMQVGAGHWPHIYRTADGFLIQLSAPRLQPLAGVIRLRNLGPHLLVPVDAALQPALLADEAAVLTQQRGLIFLPGGRVLAFAPGEPLQPEEIVVAPRRSTGNWQRPPSGPDLPSRIQEIRLEVPERPLEDMIAEGRGDLATEMPRPPGASPAKQWISKMLFGMGQGLTQVGKAFNLSGLAGMGAGWMAAALQMAPRLTEELIGRQEAALRELLRQFRIGNIEQALRQALPLGGGGDRLGIPSADARLPMNNILYSLANLLGGARGPASVWFGSLDLHAELMQEYRKQAELALERGDFRRAAYIYARLLNDYRQAALALERGGLYRDAAVLYEKKLLAPLLAARCYEAVGDFDRALLLYRRIGEYERAGDLLTELGEPERALLEYVQAVEKLIRQQRALHLAGDLLLNKAKREDLALENYQAGWALRPDGPWLPCLQRLIQRRLARAESDTLMRLVAEAESFFRKPGHIQEAESIFNELAGSAEQLPDPLLADELRDRCLILLAAKMRELATADALGTTLTNAGGWPQALRSDCQQAMKQERQQRKQAL